MRIFFSVRFIFLGLLSILSGCASYYHTHTDFNREFESGDLKKAFETLQHKEQSNNKSKFLYYNNNGLILSILGRYEESNDYFEKAYLFGEDYHKNYINEVASYWTNPLVTVYRGEDHEHLMVLYYKALNYLKMDKPDQALVECRRLNIRLQQLSDRYSSERKYRKDAFIHSLMGIIYQSVRDYNNAFIAYRNAFEIYNDEYQRLFNIRAPHQLKIDLLNTAYWSGLHEEFEYYADKFEMPGYQPQRNDAELVFFWHNGLSPVKAEWSINFVISNTPDHGVVFRNDMFGLTFPFQVDNDEDRSKLSHLEVYRVAFPKYIERPAYYRDAYLRNDVNTFPLDVAEDINRIAVHSLNERMMLEFSKGLLRAALKKATEHSMRQEDETLGAVIGWINAMTEHADTRNWQTLPHSIAYTRVPLNTGENQISLVLQDPDGRDEVKPFTYRAAAGQTLFHTFSSFESIGSAGRLY
jgi:uncharacterized protein